MKNLIICLVFVFILSCNKENSKHNTTHDDSNFKEIAFKNSSFEQIFKKSVDELTIPNESMGLDTMNENFIIEIYLDSFENFDTIIAFKNCPPISVRNLIQVNRYKNFKVYLYCEGHLLRRFSELVDLSNNRPKTVNLKPINDEGFECIYKRNYKLDNNQFIKRVYNYD